MIASHNSWTFGTPKKWWQKIINFTSKCQTLNIQEQYNKEHDGREIQTDGIALVILQCLFFLGFLILHLYFVTETDFLV